MQRRAGALAGGVARHQRQLLHRHEQPVALGVGDVEAVGLLPVQAQALHAAVDADAVVLVHHVVARPQRGELGQREAPRPPEAAPPAPVAREDLVVGEHGQPGGGQREPRRDQPHAQRGPGLAQQLGQPVPLPRVVAQDDGLDAARAQLGEVAAQPLDRALHRLGG